MIESGLFNKPGAFGEGGEVFSFQNVVTCLLLFEIGHFFFVFE